MISKRGCGWAVTNWRYYDTIYTERYLGLPQKNEKGYQDSHRQICAQPRANLLIAHGTGDDNVIMRTPFSDLTP